MKNEKNCESNSNNENTHNADASNEASSCNESFILYDLHSPNVQRAAELFSEVKYDDMKPRSATAK